MEAWILLPMAWLLLGIVLCLAEMFDGSLFLLPLGIAALLVAAWLALQKWALLPAEVELTDWKQALLAYAGLAAARVLLLRRLFRSKSDAKDVNDY